LFATYRFTSAILLHHVNRVKVFKDILFYCVIRDPDKNVM